MVSIVPVDPQVPIPYVRAYDICIIYENCDAETVEHLIPLLDYSRPNNKKVRVFPSATPEIYTYQAKEYALNKAHAILLVLSDTAAASFLGEHGNQSDFFKLIKQSCEREKESMSRILPLFLSQKIEEGTQFGIAQFSSWAYKCKNEEVLAYMERVGSLQGLFVDPTDLDAKYDKLKSFWHEAHNEIVPLTLWNISSEVDWGQIVNVAGGMVCGACCPCITLFCACCMCFNKSPKMRHIRMGLFWGNVVIFAALTLVAFGLALELNEDECAAQKTLQDCTDYLDTYKTSSFITASLFALFGIFIALLAYMCNGGGGKGRRVKKVENV